MVVLDSSSRGMHMYSQPKGLHRICMAVIGSIMLVMGSAYAEGYKAPRGPDGVRPDLNGIWQALNSANYDIEMHTASHSMQ